MAQITVDTDRDSVDSIKKIISLLEHTIAEKGGHIVTNASSSYSSYSGYSTPSSIPSSAPAPVSNPFAMFDDTPSTTNSSSFNSTSSTQQGGDIFSVFSDTPPSSSPGSYGGSNSYGSSSTYSSSKSAEDLLSEVDSEDDDFSSLNEYESDEKEDDKDFFQLESY